MEKVQSSTSSKVRDHGFLGSVYIVLSRLLEKLYFHPGYLLRKYLIGHKIVTINGVKMYLDLQHDEGLSKDIYLRGKREPVTIDHLLESDYIKSGDTVLDIGGNIGYYALPEAKLVGDTGLVYAVEPVSDNIELLKRNIELNDIQNITTHQMAMGDKEDSIKVYVREKKNLSSLQSLPGDTETNVRRVEEVEMLTVDAFAEKHIKGYPDFVRMDVEGYEISILEGMTNTLKHKPILLIEMHPMFLSNEQKERVIKILKENNYSRATITVNPKAKFTLPQRLLAKVFRKSSERGQVLEEADIDHVKQYLVHSKRVFNVFLS